MGSLQDIADAAGVSVSTVSRALSGERGVSALRREHIQMLARELGIVPDLHASSLRRGSGHGLTVIRSLEPTVVASRRIHALVDLAEEAFGAVRVQVAGTSEGPNDLIIRASALRPAAIVITCGSGNITPKVTSLLRERGIVLVAMDASVQGCDSVTVDRVTGMYQATRLLLLTGHEHPIFFASSTLDCPDERIRGIQLAYESLGRSMSEIRLIPTRGNDYAAGYSLTQDALSREVVDGLFCYNDHMAIGSLKALRDAGVEVPGDIAVIGFDDLPVCEFLPRPLTTVAQPVDAVAQAVLKVCVRRRAEPDGGPQTLKFATSLVVRETAPLGVHALRQAIFEKPEISG